MYASTCLLLWWLYDSDTACCMQSVLQKFLNLSNMKFLPTSSLCGILCDTVLSLGHADWKSKHVGQFLIVCSMMEFMLTQYMDSYTSNLVFSMPMWLWCSCFSAFSLDDAGTIILLPFMAILSIIAISFSEWPGWLQFLLDLILCRWPAASNYSDRILKCSLPSIANLISSAFMQSGMLMHDSIVLIAMHIYGYSLSLFVSWLCLDSQSVMNSCGSGL